MGDVTGTSGAERLRVVVADDHVDARALITRALEHSGRFTVVAEAADGDEAVVAAQRSQPDLVLLDLNMPHIDGLSALPRVQRVCPPTTVVVVMSVESSAEASDEAAKAGAAAFLEKDPGYRGLVRDLLDMVGARGTGGESTLRSAHWHLPADLESGRRARRQLRSLLADWQLEELRDEVELLTTELVNNAVTHARSDVLLAVHWRDSALRVEVSDAGRGTPHRPSAALDATHGRGLFLVEALSAAWGTAVDGTAKTIWFELPVEPARV